jgi:hypothetical protein
MIMPFGENTPTNRLTGAAGVAASAVAAGIIASSSGSAIVAPTPLRKVRRGNDIFEINITPSPF